tara:strand:- start:2809 stop:3540 length:732 start_codon:yes stop_codon:yes gene_type:complete
MERLQKYIETPGKSEKNIDIAERMLSNKQYAERVGDLGVKLHIWNIEQGDLVDNSGTRNPQRNIARYKQDSVYEKLQGVRNMKSRVNAYGKHNPLGFSSFITSADEVILGLMEKIQDREMKEEQYTALSEISRADLYNQIMNETKDARLQAMKETGYNPNDRSVSDNRKIEQARDTRILTARILGEKFNINLKKPGEIKYFPHELAKMPLVMARRHILLGNIAEIVDGNLIPGKIGQKRLYPK